jgi:signal transduction histidine kinase
MSLKQPRLQTILLLTNLVILLFPLASIHFLRLYENELVRQTESELISQAAFLSAIYKQKIIERLNSEGVLAQYYGLQINAPIAPEDYYKPIPVSLDLAKDPIQPPRPKGKVTKLEADRLALEVAADLLPVLRDAQRTTLAGIKILDVNGIAVIGQKENLLSFAHVPEVQSAMGGVHKSVLRKRITDGHPTLSSISRGGKVDIYVALPILEGHKLLGVVWVTRTPKDIAKALYEKREDIQITLWSAVLLIIALAIFISYTVTGPVKRLTEQVDRFSSGDKSADFLIKNPVTYEISRLAERFRHMAQTVRHRSEYIKNFAMHISHEFKTPLTSIQGTVELLQDHENSMPEEQKDRFLKNVASDADRLNRLVQRLLELARADVYEPNADTVNLNNVLESLQIRYFEQGLKIDFELSHEIQLAMSREVLETILINFLDNSRQHGAKEVSIQITELGNQKVSLLFCNDGDAISEANMSKIFTPFFTTYREGGGTGLGMGIVKSLVNAHNGEITVLPSNQGAKFKLVLCTGTDG